MLAKAALALKFSAEAILALLLLQLGEVRLDEQQLLLVKQAVEVSPPSPPALLSAEQDENEGKLYAEIKRCCPRPEPFSSFLI
jgi:hypothetical protein